MNVVENKKHFYTLEDNYNLLQLMMDDMENQSSLYTPGPYWKQKCDRMTKQVEAYGLVNFRGGTNIIGQSFTDSTECDARYYLDIDTINVLTKVSEFRFFNK
jgi:hypothetical protein